MSHDDAKTTRAQDPLRIGQLTSQVLPSMAKMVSVAAMCAILAMVTLQTCTATASTAVSIVSSTDTVPLGSAATIEVTVSPNLLSPHGTVVWPFVDNLQWGAYCNVTSDATCSIPLPFPRSGACSVVLWRLSSCSHCRVVAGKHIVVVAVLHQAPDRAYCLSPMVDS